MKKDFVEYLPYIVITLLIVSVIAIYERGGFEKEETIPTLPPSATSQTALPTSTETPKIVPILNLTAFPTPTPSTPSIQRRHGGEDD